MSNTIDSAILGTSSIDFYKGIEGRRNAFTRFLEEIQKSISPVELYVTSGSDIFWLSHDKAFLTSAGDFLAAMLDKISNINILHNFDRSTSALLYVINYWIPIYLSGKVKGYILNDYIFNQPKTTIFIIRKKVCVFSLESENLEDCITFFSTQKDIIASFENLFLLMQQSCISLNKITYKEPAKYITELLNIKKKPGSYFAYLKTMSAVCMPPFLYEKVIKTLDISKEEQKKRLSFYKASFQEFMRNTFKFRCSIILQNNLSHEFINNERIKYNGIDFFEGHDVLVEKRLCLEHIQYLCQIIKKSSFEIIFIKTPEYINETPNFNYILKEDDKVIAFDSNKNKTDYEFFLSDSEIINNTFFLFHRNIAQSIPEEYKSLEKIFYDIKSKEQQILAVNDKAALFLSGLTKKEITIAKLLSRGITTYGISAKEHISENTVKTHIRNIYRKLGINSKFELIKLMIDS
jgi:DNA-binding CsgD family transcriptional regulator